MDKKEERFCTISIKKSTFERFYIIKKRIEDSMNEGQKINNDEAMNIILNITEEGLNKKMK